MQQHEWDNLLCKMTADIAPEKHNQVVQGSQHYVDQLAHQLWQLLNTRSDSLIALNKLNDVLEEAKMMTTLNPTSPVGILREGLIQGYIAQSKDMINIYLCALSIASSINVSKEYDGNKADFIMRLPYDIVGKIVDYLWSNSDTKDIPAFLYASKSWRKAILQSTPFLVHHVITPESYSNTHNEMITLASHTRKIVTHGETPLNDILGKHDLIHLEFLHAERRAFPGHRRLPHPFPSVRLSLADLQIQAEYGYRCTLDDIMDQCPNLVSLKWRGRVLNSEKTLQYPQLKALDISYDYALPNEYQNELENLLPRLPSLVVLALDTTPNVDHLNLVNRYCPSLKCIKYCQRFNSFIRWPYTWDTAMEPGIQDISIGEGIYEGITQDAMDFVVRTSNTLKSVYYNHAHTSPDAHSEGLVVPHEAIFPHLTHLSGVPQDHISQELFQTLISRAPSLEKIIMLKPYLFWESSDAIEAMLACEHLTTTDVRMEEEEQDIPALQRFLNHHIHLGTQSPLRSLAIAIWTPECEQALLSLLPSLTMLEELYIAVDLPQATVARMIDNMRTSPHLRLKRLIINFSGAGSLTEPIFAGLKHVHCIESLEIKAIRIFTLAALSLLVCDHLENICIPSYGLDPHVLSILRYKFPKLVTDD
ncbi:hypothetical protein K492DRAFT_200516 [Lichtheimia hyalospora FSU 10163]|nr:hypothetical protein K492DRAFT_200516 [Lichtheimia hyalospora FSU 10163]